tara:strand:+ start:393 stop:542 length:150 start_codon:yes stop_codon:yes gene_type:complete
LLFNKKISNDDAKQKLFLAASADGLIIEGDIKDAPMPQWMKSYLNKKSR